VVLLPGFGELGFLKLLPLGGPEDETGIPLVVAPASGGRFTTEPANDPSRIARGHS
jgi:hypothetical protein